MKFNDVKRFSAYVREIYHSEYITQGLSSYSNAIENILSPVSDALLFNIFFN